MTGLLHNEDCTDFFYHQSFPPGKAGEIADRYNDVIAVASSENKAIKVLRVEVRIIPSKGQ